MELAGCLCHMCWQLKMVCGPYNKKQYTWISSAICWWYGIPCYHDIKQITLWIPASQGHTQNFLLEMGRGLMLRLYKIYVWIIENNIITVYISIPILFANKFIYIPKLLYIIIFPHPYRAASWHYQSCIYSPTDAPVSCLKKQY